MESSSHEQWPGNIREILAANGSAVLQVNYRGGSGRGAKYQKAIYADWGNTRNSPSSREKQLSADYAPAPSRAGSFDSET